jgi:sec-independent protein translocase protein TatA
MMGLSTTHLLLLLLVVVLLFGRGKISELMGDVGKGINSFKKGLADDEQNATNAPKSIDANSSASTDARDRSKSL